jgi:hypothetical protein
VLVARRLACICSRAHSTPTNQTTVRGANRGHAEHVSMKRSARMRQALTCATPQRHPTLGRENRPLLESSVVSAVGHDVVGQQQVRGWQATQAAEATGDAASHMEVQEEAASVRVLVADAAGLACARAAGV